MSAARGLPALLIALALGSACARARPAPGETAAGAERLALTLPDLRGRPHDLSQLRGKVVLLDFWATWCEPCKRGLPITEKLARDNAARGLVVYAVSADEDSSAIPAFIARYNLGLPVLLDPNGAAAERLGGAQIPFAVLVDRQGRVRHRETGSDEAAEARVAQGLERLLAEPLP